LKEAAMAPPDNIRALIMPPHGASLPGIDLALLDPGDEEDRAQLVRAQHPKLAEAIRRGQEEIEVNGEPVNPRLHLVIHEVVAAQLWSGDPPQARQAAERLLSAGYEHHEVLHAISAAVTEEVLAAMAGEPSDPSRLAAALEALPGEAAANGAPDLDLGSDGPGVADEEAFDDTRALLLEAHRAWLSDRGLSTDDWVAFQLLHHKWAYRDGHLGRWRVTDLREILLELFPRKVIVDDPDLPDVVPAVGRFLSFLDDAALLDRDSHPLPRLHDELERLTEPFLTRMRDTTGFGIAKSLVASMIDEGVDPGDSDAVEAWIARYNALPDDERDRLVPGPPAERRGVVPMALPDDNALAATALDTPAMRQMSAFLDWVGDGHRLTQKGNIKLADGKALVEALGTDDRFDEAIGDRTFKTQSTTDLPGVDLVFRLALKARLARRHKGRVQRTKRGAHLAEDSLAAWQELVDAMIDIGLVDAGREDRYGLRWWSDYLQDGAVGLLMTAAEVGSPLPLEALAEAAYEGLGEAYDLDSMPDVVRRWLPDSLASGIGALVDRLVWLGAATRDGVVMERGPLGDSRRVGGELGLTDLGRWFVRPMLIGQGYEVPDAAELADAPAGKLLDIVADQPLETMHAHVRAWAAAHDGAADELAAAARETADPGLRAVAFEALDVIGDRAVPVVRAMAGEPELRPWAMAWLVARGDDQPDAFDAADAPAGFVQALAVGLVSAGPDTVAEMLADGIPTGAQTGVIEHLWRVDDPYTEPVLEALAQSGERKVAKAARKALFKHRSAASRRRR
jgi:hypothetical protein